MQCLSFFFFSFMFLLITLGLLIKDNLYNIRKKKKKNSVISGLLLVLFIALYALHQLA